MNCCGAAALRVAVGAVLVALAFGEHAWRPQDLPSPFNDTNGICGNEGRPSPICDPDHVLSERTRRRYEHLFQVIGNVSRKHAGACKERFTGFQVVLVIVREMDPSYEAGRGAHLFVHELQTRWRVGVGECKAGVLIAVNDHKVAFAGKKNVPLFGRFTIQALDKLYLPRWVPDSDWTPSGEGARGVWAVLISFVVLTSVVLCFCFYYHRRYARRSARCRAALRHIDADTAAAHTAVFTLSTCPLCLDPFQDHSEDCAMLPCNHQFHSSCLTAWLDRAKSRRCPVCRAPVSARTHVRRDLAAFMELRRFRIQRAHHLFPEFVTRAVINNCADNWHVNIEKHVDYSTIDRGLRSPLYYGSFSQGQSAAGRPGLCVNGRASLAAVL